MESAPTIKVSIKWNKEIINDVELNMAEDIETFKNQIYSLTDVPVDK